jgi:mRNA export factor
MEVSDVGMFKRVLVIFRQLLWLKVRARKPGDIQYLRYFQINSWIFFCLQVNHENQSPVLSSAFSSDGSAVFTGGTDKAVRMWNLGQQVSNGVHPQIGAHNAPVKSVAFLPTTNIVVSGGWDKMLKFWDARQPNPVVQIELPERVYDMDVRGKLMVIATAGRQVLVYDVTGTPVEVSRKESPLKYQTRCVSCFPDQTGYAIGSIEGRVHINYVQTVPNKESFAFKCHRQDNNVFSVNALAFHPLGTFATAGSDGVVTFWDKDNKQRLKVFPAGPRPISCARFNQQGNLFAYASSYDWSKGSAYYAPGTPNEIYIHYTTDEDIKSKGSFL